MKLRSTLSKEEFILISDAKQIELEYQLFETDLSYEVSLTYNISFGLFDFTIFW